MGRRVVVNQISNQIRSLRIARDMTQSELAKLSGLSRQAINAIEANRYIPNALVAIQLAKALGSRVEDIFQCQEDLPECDVTMIGGVNTKGKRVAVARVRNRLVGHELSGFRDFQDGFSHADGVLIHPKGKVQLLTPSGKLEKTGLILGCDPSLGILCDHISRHSPEVRVHWLQYCSQNALDEVKAGNGHIAGCHFLGDLNRVKARQAIASTGGLLVSYASWEQGFVVASGNPKGIRGIEEIGRPDVRFINREKGSGSRLLIDRLLGEAGIPNHLVSGYDRAVNSHLAVGRQVMDGGADAGISLRAVAEALELDFIPLTQVHFDLVIPRDFLDHPAISMLLDLLETRAFRMELAALPGYDITNTGKILEEIPDAA
ncbi:helix-turn-helix domain-containing protein [bacterium]|nr:helix-turn-helix domain-containing protein [bacterium]